MSSELVRRAQRGDDDAFETLAAPAYDRLYAIARRILRDPYAAEDAVQEAMVKAWRDIRELRDPDRFEAWLHRLLVNACHDQSRRARRHAALTPLSGDYFGSRDEVDTVGDRDELEVAFQKLSVEQRAVLVLTYYVGMPGSDVAEALGVPVGTVRSRLHYGLQAIRGALTSRSRTTPTPEHGR